MKTPSSKYVPSGPVMAASHSKKFSSVTGPAAIPRNGQNGGGVSYEQFLILAHHLEDCLTTVCILPSTFSELILPSLVTLLLLSLSCNSC